MGILQVKSLKTNKFKHQTYLCVDYFFSYLQFNVHKQNDWLNILEKYSNFGVGIKTLTSRIGI